MSFHICLLGIDGSGKSTITASLPAVLATELNIISAGAGDTFQVVNGEENYLTSKSYQKNFPLAARLSRYFKGIAKKYVDNRKIYPVFKLMNLYFQDIEAQKLVNKYSPGLMISDGNLLLSTLGRAANYLQPASESEERSDSRQTVNPDDLKSLIEYIIDKKPLPEKTRIVVPDLIKIGILIKFLHLTVIDKLLLPDMVIFMDILPERALDRINIRGKKIDLHENINDLTQARNMYLKTIEAFNKYRGRISAHSISVDNHTPDQVLSEIIKLIEQGCIQKSLNGIQ
jgi:deoxyadenosine/deoxycytidine kinase